MSDNVLEPEEVSPQKGTRKLWYWLLVLLVGANVFYHFFWSNPWPKHLKKKTNKQKFRYAVALAKGEKALAQYQKERSPDGEVYRENIPDGGRTKEQLPKREGKSVPEAKVKRKTKNGIVWPRKVLKEPRSYFVLLRRPGAFLARGKSPKSIRFMTKRLPDSFNPLNIMNKNTAELVDLLFEPLVRAERGLGFSGVLAASWFKNGEDLVFRIRRDVFWHDGKPLTADDVAFTLRAITRRPVTPAHRFLAKHIRFIKATSTHELLVSFRGKLKNLLQYFQFHVIPRHAFKRRAPSDEHIFWKKPIGTGPYFLARRDSNKLYFSRFSKYRKTSSSMPNWTLEASLDLGTREAGLLNGKVRLLTSAEPSSLLKWKKSSRLAIVPNHRNLLWYLEFNHKRPPVQDPRVRRALLYVLERVKLGKKFFGPGMPVNATFSPSDPRFDRALPVRGKDLEMAKKLLEAAGWKKGKGGYLRKKNGKSLRLTIYVPCVFKKYHKFAYSAFPRAWRLGISVYADYCWSKSLEKKYTLVRKNFDMILRRWDEDPVRGPYELIHSSGKRNIYGYKNAKLDELLEKAELANSLEEERKIYRSIHALMYKDVPHIPLWSSTGYAATNLSRISISPLSFYQTVTSWRR